MLVQIVPGSIATKFVVRFVGKQTSYHYLFRTQLMSLIILAAATELTMHGLLALQLSAVTVTARTWPLTLSYILISTTGLAARSAN
jgi:predicted branched-subunit amino acid permease